MPTTEWEKIKEVRLRIDDPKGFVNLETVEDTGDVPAAPVSQTAYRVESKNAYYYSETEAGATFSDYERADIYISDTQLVDLITALGYKSAACRALQRIARRLGGDIAVVKNTNGAESVEFTSLVEMYRYYRELAADCREENKEDSGTVTSRWGQMKQPEIGGGNL